MTRLTQASTGAALSRSEDALARSRSSLAAEGMSSDMVENIKASLDGKKERGEGGEGGGGG